MMIWASWRILTKFKTAQQMGQGTKIHSACIVVPCPICAVLNFVNKVVSALCRHIFVVRTLLSIFVR